MRLLQMAKKLQDLQREIEQDRRKLTNKQREYLVQLSLIAAEAEKAIEKIDEAAARAEDTRQRLTDLEITQNEVWIHIGKLEKGAQK